MCAGAAFVAAACASLDRHAGQPLPLDAMNGTAHGTHYSRVLEAFGPPAAVTRLAAGMAFKYEYTRLEERQYGLILPGELGKWIKAVYASADATGQSVVFTFDANGELVASAADAWHSDAGDGFSFSLIFSVGSLTDTSLYTDASARLNNWGMSLTQPITVALNAGQSLESGNNGIELNGTSRDVGQHTLELNER